MQSLRKFRQTDHIRELEPAEKSSAIGTRHAVISTYADFWLLGGFSIFIWVLLTVGQYFRTHSAVDAHMKGLFEVSLFLSLFINTPHFMASYKVAYSKGTNFILRNWFQLLIVPLVLLSAFGTLLFRGPSELGHRLENILVLLMYSTVGWHYVKQTYGCMMVHAHYSGYRMSQTQKALIRWNLYGVWFLNLVNAHVGPWTQTYYGFNYTSFDFPSYLPTAAWLFVISTFIGILGFVVGKKKIESGQFPTLNMSVSFVAVYLWWVPLFMQREFYSFFVPMFHSLQYLPFVYRFERGKLESTKVTNLPLRGTMIAFGLAAAGFAIFELIPNSLDKLNLGAPGSNPAFFFAAVGIFINTHHYFIDNVIWRFQDKEMRDFLLNEGGTKIQTPP
jgi:hypothetical protein